MKHSEPCVDPQVTEARYLNRNLKNRITVTMEFVWSSFVICSDVLERKIEKLDDGKHLDALCHSPYSYAYPKKNQHNIKLASARKMSELGKC
ncbi:unnamed protein product [Dovyalis caffra]|uniref:Uncharacterized protein n=1 Tax=Dovyalis caffra TaxID=77055 RepID=A0AAV1RCT2_9ROSI|nr:unnamed protein product [Dovyalis caffra]